MELQKLINSLFLIDAPPEAIKTSAIHCLYCFL